SLPSVRLQQRCPGDVRVPLDETLTDLRGQRLLGSRGVSSGFLLGVIVDERLQPEVVGTVQYGTDPIVLTLCSLARRNQHVTVVPEDVELLSVVFDLDIAHVLGQGNIPHSKVVVSTVAVNPLTITEHTGRQNRGCGEGQLGATGQLRHPVAECQSLL